MVEETIEEDIEDELHMKEQIDVCLFPALPVLPVALVELSPKGLMIPPAPSTVPLFYESKGAVKCLATAVEQLSGRIIYRFDDQHLL